MQRVARCTNRDKCVDLKDNILCTAFFKGIEGIHWSYRYVLNYRILQSRIIYYSIIIIYFKVFLSHPLSRVVILKVLNLKTFQAVKRQLHFSVLLYVCVQKVMSLAVCKNWKIMSNGLGLTCESINILGVGNCLLRAISYCLYNRNQKYLEFWRGWPVYSQTFIQPRPAICDAIKREK